MAKFRACFLAEDGRLLGETTFTALWRNDAVEIAARLAEAAAADCSEYEVWRGATKIAHRSFRHPSPE